MEKNSLSYQYDELVVKFEKDLKQLYLAYIFSSYGLKIGDFIQVNDNGKMGYYHIDDIEFRGPNFSLQGRTLSSPYFRFKFTPVNEQGDVLSFGTAAEIYEDYTNVTKINMHFSGRQIDIFGNVLPL